MLRPRGVKASLEDTFRVIRWGGECGESGALCHSTVLAAGSCAGWGCGTLTRTSVSCRAWARAEPGHRQSLNMGRAWTWAEPCFNRTTLGGQILPGLPDQHQQRQHLHCCSAPESLHCCTVLSLQGQGARAGDMELPKCWVAPQMSSKWQRKCESGSRVEERENELSAQMSVKTELSPRAMKPFSLSHSKQGAIFSSAAPSCLGWAAGSLTTLAAEKGCPDVGWDVAACLLQL